MKMDDIAWCDVQWNQENLRSSTIIDLAGPGLLIGEPIQLDALALANASDDGVDPAMELLAADDDFTYVRLPLSFRPPDGLSVSFVSLDLELHSEGGDVAAWSMEPSRVERVTKTALDGKVSGKLSLGLVEVGGEVGAGRELVTYLPTLEAFGLGSDRPAWEFRPAPGLELRGVQLLHLVVRRARGARARASMTLNVEVRERGLFARLFGNPTMPNGEATFLI